MAIRIGQIGTAHVHAAGKAAALRQASGVEFVGVYEPNPEIRAAKLRDRAWSEIPWLDSAEALLGDSSIQAVFIETHPLENLRWVRRAIQAGKNVHCDKAPGSSLAELRELVRIAAEQKLIFQQGYQFRYNRGLAFALRAAQDGLIGRPFHIRARIPIDLEDYEKLRPEIEPCPGGMFYYLGSHMVDLVCATLGRPSRVTSFLRGDGESARPYVDNAIAVFEFPRATAVIETSAMETRAFAHRRFELFGTEGSVIVEPFEPPNVLLALRQERDGYVSGWQPVEVGNVPRYVEDIAELVSCILGEQRPQFTPEHDLIVHEALLKACGVIG